MELLLPDQYARFVAEAQSTLKNRTTAEQQHAVSLLAQGGRPEADRVLDSLGAALVSEWFVSALEPAIKTMGMSQAFAGIVVVSIAGNAVENVAGIRLAAKNRPDYAMSVILYSSLVSASQPGSPQRLPVAPTL